MLNNIGDYTVIHHLRLINHLDHTHSPFALKVKILLMRPFFIHSLEHNTFNSSLLIFTLSVFQFYHMVSVN